MDRVSNDPDLSALIAADPLGGGVSAPVSFLRSIFEMRPAIEPECFDRCPVLLAHPGDDRWTPLSASLPFFERIAGPKDLVVLEAAVTSRWRIRVDRSSMRRCLG